MITEQRPAPETDALVEELHRSGCEVSLDLREHASTLERQRDEALEELRKIDDVLGYDEKWDGKLLHECVAILIAQRDEARRQARLGWERQADKDAAYGKALAQRDRLL